MRPVLKFTTGYIEKQSSRAFDQLFGDKRWALYTRILTELTLRLYLIDANKKKTNVKSSAMSV